MGPARTFYFARDVDVFGPNPAALRVYSASDSLRKLEHRQLSRYHALRFAQFRRKGAKETLNRTAKLPSQEDTINLLLEYQECECPPSLSLLRPV